MGEFACCQHQIRSSSSLAATTASDVASALRISEQCAIHALQPLLHWHGWAHGWLHAKEATYQPSFLCHFLHYF